MNVQELNKEAIKESMKKIKESYSRDELIMQAVNALKEEESITNTKYERLRSMYWLYWPEKVSKVEEMEELSELNQEPPKTTMGYDLSDREKQLIKEYQGNLQQEIKNKELLEKFINEETMKLAPKTSQLITPLLTARLITLAGGFKKMALMPSSTIQLLGAEKALFKHLTHGAKQGAKPAKNGIIITIKQVQKDHHKGKAARQLANEIMKTIRQDYFGGRE